MLATRVAGGCGPVAPAEVAGKHLTRQGTAHSLCSTHVETLAAVGVVLLNDLTNGHCRLPIAFIGHGILHIL